MSIVRLKLNTRNYICEPIEEVTRSLLGPIVDGQLSVNPKLGSSYHLLFNDEEMRKHCQSYPQLLNRVQMVL